MLAQDSKQVEMEVEKMQMASSVIEPASWEQQFTFIATSDAI